MKSHANRIEINVWPDKTASVNLLIHNEIFVSLRRCWKKTETKDKAIKRAERLQRSIKFPIYVRIDGDDFPELYKESTAKEFRQSG
ncbi:hypothetical protein LCGC14_0142450 [marine sediment metagenome]|uniref:Uncharacterized protein n=1 Tax=marine sediment metagenome TaxID=412755 RepID=A0A0F9V189_9ZZZZ